VLISAYYYGFSFIDYNLERKQYTVSDSVNYMKKNRGIVMGNGIVFALVLAIPLIGIALSSFVAIISAVAATISLHKKNQKEQANSSLTA
jgi:CysZ protein